MMTYIYLFYEFFKAGLFAVGGGMATIPFLYEISNVRGWYSVQDLVDMIAISESTPGPIGVNMSTFAGYRAGGFGGAILASLALVLPSYIIILIVARMLTKFQQSKFVKGAFMGLRPAVVGLLLVASLAVFKVTFFTEAGEGFLGWIRNADILAIVLFVLIFLGIRIFKKHPVVYIGIGAVLGILINVLKNII